MLIPLAGLLPAHLRPRSLSISTVRYGTVCSLLSLALALSTFLLSSYHRLPQRAHQQHNHHELRIQSPRSPPRTKILRFPPHLQRRRRTRLPRRNHASHRRIDRLGPCRQQTAARTTRRIVRTANTNRIPSFHDITRCIHTSQQEMSPRLSCLPYRQITEFTMGNIGDIAPLDNTVVE